MENQFESKIDSFLQSRPSHDSRFKKFNTNPFVLMFQSKQQQHSKVSDIEKEIIPAKIFSSMETSAGRIVEDVVLPHYGWEQVPSKMHTPRSVLDGRNTKRKDQFVAATLKSGPRCLNDDMAKDIAGDIVDHMWTWARGSGVTGVEFTYAVLYGTERQSNKKDWHVLRNIEERIRKMKGARVKASCKERWGLEFKQGKFEANIAVRIGLDWWSYLGDHKTWLEVCIALLRACVPPSGKANQKRQEYIINDLGGIVDLSFLPDGYNVTVLQKSQYEWLLFLASHFCDELVDGTA